MHREILGVIQTRSAIVDHRDHDGLNNQRSNIWICTNSVNLRNCRPDRHRPGASGYRGVYATGHGRWKVAIRVEGKWITPGVGTFALAEDAGLAYDREAAQHLGKEIVTLNFGG